MLVLLASAIVVLITLTDRNFFVFINLINSFIAISFHENPFCCFQVTSLEWTNALCVVHTITKIVFGNSSEFLIGSSAMRQRRVW